MALFDKPLDQISETDLQFLVQSGIQEDYRIEYKSSVSLDKKQDKIDLR
ncbi:MAG: hypothetical protein JOZ48_10385 [Acidobacteriaceae bacterium]|nr:hypothetical protein [Acidobacteriaceae bacterium]